MKFFIAIAFVSLCLIGSAFSAPPSEVRPPSAITSAESDETANSPESAESEQQGNDNGSSFDGQGQDQDYVDLPVRVPESIAIAEGQIAPKYFIMSRPKYFINSG